VSERTTPQAHSRPSRAWRLRFPCRWHLAGALVAIAVVSGCAALASAAHAEPPRGWDPNQDPPRNWTARDYSTLITSQRVEVAALDAELKRAPGDEVTKAIIDIGSGCAIGKLSGGLKEIYDLYGEATSHTAHLSFFRKLARRDRDLEYLTWLNNWFLAYNPKYKNRYDRSRSWLNNSRSPAHRFYHDFRDLLLGHAGKCCPANREALEAMASFGGEPRADIAGCPGIPPSQPPPPPPMPVPTPPATNHCHPDGVGVCWLQIEVNGDKYPGPNAEYGVGMVTVTPGAGEPVAWAFSAGTWASQFNGEPGCLNGAQSIDECYQLQWTIPETVTLTAYGVPSDGYGPNDPLYDSKFAGWGGDCAVAGTSPTCTLAIGDQVTTAPSNSPDYSLTVVAYFQATDTGVG
jgi:hypothetical protein